MNKKNKKKFRYKCVGTKIDNKAPYFPALIYLNVVDERRNAKRVRTIDHENMKLLKKMNVISRLGVSHAARLPPFALA